MMTEQRKGQAGRAAFITRRQFGGYFIAGLAGQALAATLSGCSTPPQRTPFPELTYGHLPPFRLDVGQIDVMRAYQAPGRAPNVDHLFPQLPADVAVRWANDRLQAAGQGGRAVFTVINAAAVEVPLQRTTGIKGVFTTDQSDRYDLTMAVRLDITHQDGRHGAIDATAARSQTVAEDMTLNQREALWFHLTEETMMALNAELDRLIPQYLGGFLR